MRQLRFTIPIWLVILSGCSGSTISFPTTVPQYKEEPQAIQVLRMAASARKIHWRIFCNPGDDEIFSGWAVQPDAPFANYIEDGAKADWYVSGNSQEEVAQKLFKAILLPPNSQPSRKQPDPEHHRKICPPRITG